MRQKQVKSNKRPIYPLTDYRQVLDISDYLEANSIKFGKRNKMLFVLGCSTGYRPGDLVELKVRDVREALEVGCFVIYENKVNKNGQEFVKKKKPREAEIFPELANLLYEYIEDKKDYEYMFKSNKVSAGNITVGCISKEIKKAAKYFKYEYIAAYSMRKTYGWNQYIASGENIHYVQRLFNHESWEYTERYIMVEQIKGQEYRKSLGKFPTRFKR